MTPPALPPSLHWTPAIGALIDLAIEEDLGRGDPTTWAAGLSVEPTGAALVSRVQAVVCGLPLLPWIVQRARASIALMPGAIEGELVAPGAVLARLSGPAGELLRLERTLLNFMMRLCGVATLTRRHVLALEGTGAMVADTRKTLPGWRALDKYAVRVGGGVNHRADLGSGILLKDNHLAASRSITDAVRRARQTAPHPLRVEVEVESLEAALEARAAGAEVLLLDNMSPVEVKRVVEALDSKVIVEVSGGITHANIRDYALAGAQIISVGALTHSAPAVDLSLEFDSAKG